MSEQTTITVARGDGIGPEIMDATLAILEAAGARLDYDFVEIGEQAYLAGHSSGITPDAWETIRRNRILLPTYVLVGPFIPTFAPTSPTSTW